MTMTAYNEGIVRLSVTETAKLIRKRLKDRFPGAKFSVRSSKYSGGASIDVSWLDGPTAKHVDDVVGAFAGEDFDGMIDLKVYLKAWLLPDGSVTLAHRPQTTGSFTEIITDPPHPDAKLVRFGADFVQTHRSVSDGYKESLIPAFEERFRLPYEPEREYDADRQYGPDFVRLVHGGWPEKGSVLLARIAHRVAAPGFEQDEET